MWNYRAAHADGAWLLPRLGPAPIPDLVEDALDDVVVDAPRVGVLHRVTGDRPDGVLAVLAVERDVHRAEEAPHLFERLLREAIGERREGGLDLDWRDDMTRQRAEPGRMLVMRHRRRHLVAEEALPSSFDFPCRERLQIGLDVAISCA